jgi:hypothetical protein
VLLGASNLSLSFPRVIEAARALWCGPLEFFVAMGFGRSYGQESKFFGKKISGILQSEIWSALDRAPRAPTVAILADVGNDLAYEAPVESLVAWVATTLDRLTAIDARLVLNNLPLESLRSIGAIRFRVFRSILFPRCRLTRDELLRRAEALSGRLGELAAERKIPAFAGENAWYGLDPIHPRRRAAGEIWQRMLSALEPSGRMPAWTAPPRGDAKLLRRIHAESWSPEALRRDAPPPSAQLADGSTVALF